MFKNIWKSKLSIFVFVNLLIVGFQIFIISFFYNQMNSEIPLWYTSNWGLDILSPKQNIILFPFLSILILISSAAIFSISQGFYQQYFDRIILYGSSFFNLFLTYSLTNIIKKTTFSNLFFLNFVQSELLNSFFISTVLAAFLAPLMIGYFKRKELVTDPKKHFHPGMILKYPSARGGGVIFAISFVTTSLLFVKLNLTTLAILVASVLAAAIGLLDDISNTTTNKKFKIFGNPFFRLFVLLPIPILILIYSGISVQNIGNPFGDPVNLNFITWNVLNSVIYPVSLVFTFVWILWVINLLSWSNGVDGQYSGIIAISGIVISLLSLRFINVTDMDINNAKLAIITAGAALGLLPYTWNPSKIMWGFGATSAGIILAALSILSSTKISISILVLLIPFMDAVITILRRILNRQNPLKGDRGHLHHLLLNRGWSVKQIATFYWFSTLVMGTIAFFSSDKDLPLVILTCGGIISFFIILLNLRIDIKK